MDPKGDCEAVGREGWKRGFVFHLSAAFLRGALCPLRPVVAGAGHCWIAVRIAVSANRPCWRSYRSQCVFIFARVLREIRTKVSSIFVLMGAG